MIRSGRECYQIETTDDLFFANTTLRAWTGLVPLEETAIPFLPVLQSLTTLLWEVLRASRLDDIECSIATVFHGSYSAVRNSAHNPYGTILDISKSKIRTSIELACIENILFRNSSKVRSTTHITRPTTPKSGGKGPLIHSLTETIF